MDGKKRYNKYYKFLVYLVVVVLVNLAGITLFYRADLTSGNIYSLSEASRRSVATLAEPLTVNVFFTKNLPAPHNNTERYLRDLLEEYSIHANDYFNYRFFDVSAEEGDISEEAKKNQDMARNYGIFPVQIQNIEQDEVKFQKAYMGLVMIHGDVIEKIPAITSTEGIEYTITSKIDKMNNKISALIGLDEQIDIKLYFSSSLGDVAPQLRMSGLMEVPGKVEALVGELNDAYYGKLSFSRLDPSADTTLAGDIRRYGLLTLRWPSMNDRSGNKVLTAGNGSAGLVVERGGKYQAIPLIQVINLPIFGTQYQLADMSRMEETLGEVIDDVIDINKKIGYLADHGTLPVSGGGGMPGQDPQMEGLTNFNRIVSEDYSFTSVRLEEGLPDGIDCLIIAGPREEYSDYDLYQIDQFLMKGKSLAIFLDSFNEIIPNQEQMRASYNQGPLYLPLNTGLEKLLEHYGAKIDKSYVLDMNCFEQQVPQVYGGGKRAIYYAPIIKNEKINKDRTFTRGIKALVTVKSSPVELRKDTIESRGLSGDILFTSSDEAWLMSGRISLNPWEMRPPDDPSVMESHPLAVLIEGEFPSYFAGKQVPEKPAAGEEDGGKGEESPPAAEPDPAQRQITGEGAIIEQGKPGKVFLIGSSEVLKNNVIDEQGNSPNATFIMNLVDHLNEREEYAAMRSKMLRFNPLRETSGGVKTFVKSFNIAGLPVIVVVCGIAVWFRRTARKRAIQLMFKRTLEGNRL